MADVEYKNRKPEDVHVDGEIVVGSLRRIGQSGPVYEVLAVLNAQTVEIRVIGSDERIPYPLASFLADPED